MKNKLLRILNGNGLSRRGRGEMRQGENDLWMREQLRKMETLNQAVISVKAAKA